MSENNPQYLRNVMDLLEIKSDHCSHKDSCTLNLIKQLAKSAGTGLAITLTFSFADLIKFYGTKHAYSTGLLCFILCFFIRGGICLQKLYRKTGDVNYFIPGAIAGFLGVMVIEEDSRTPIVCYVFARALYKREKNWKTNELEYAFLFIFTSSWMGYYYTFEKDCMPPSIRKLYEKFVSPTPGENLLRELCHNYRANEIQKMLQRRGLA